MPWTVPAAAYALHHLIEHEIDLSEVGAWTYDPRVLLKIVLLSYSPGNISSRRMEAACCRDVLFMAISGDSAPYVSILAAKTCRVGRFSGLPFPILKIEKYRTSICPYCFSGGPDKGALVPADSMFDLTGTLGSIFKR